MQHDFWLTAIFTQMPLQTSEFDLRPRDELIPIPGDAPGYGGNRPSAKMLKFFLSRSLVVPPSRLPTYKSVAHTARCLRPTFTQKSAPTPVRTAEDPYNAVQK